MAVLDHDEASRQSCTIQNAEDLREILNSPNPLENLLRIEESAAPFVIELLYKELKGPALEDVYRKRCLKYLKAMGKRFRVLPPSLFLTNITRSGDRPLTGGGFADIYKGKTGGVNVCLKVLRVHMAENERKRQKVIADFCQEALIWTQLRHPNVIPLLGVNTSLFTSSFCLVSPWMTNGDIISFLKENPDHSKVQSIYEIMAGLDYLHSFSPPIVHGDIKGANILVSEKHRCLLADFGLAAISAETMSMIHTTSGAFKGSIRWMAPELYAITNGEGNNKTAKEDKTPRDIYAFACTMLEIMTGKPPFSEFLIDAAVIYQVSVRRIRPERPAEGWCPDHMWKLVEVCWDEDPLKRPRAKALHSYLESLVLSGNASSGEPNFIGYFDPANPVTRYSAATGARVIDSYKWGRGSSLNQGASLAPSTENVESRASTPRMPALPLPLSLRLPQTVNSNGSLETEEMPAPGSPTARQYAAKFFQLNEPQVKEAIENSGSYVRKFLDWGIHDQDRYMKTALEEMYNYSSTLVTSLEVVGRLHPVIGVTVVAFNLSIVSLYDKQIRDITIVDLLIRIQQTIVSLLRLRYLSDPEDRGDDGQPIWDRLQQLLVTLTTDIKDAGTAIDTAIANGTSISNTDTSYLRKFDEYQGALRRAFSHHPALSKSEISPQPPALDSVGNVDRSHAESPWMERIDSFISHFQTFLSILEDDTERPERARMVQNSHSLPPKTGQRSPPNMPAGGPLLRHTPDFSGNTPSPSSAYHLPPSVPPRGFAEANFRPPVPPSALSNPNPSLTVGVRFSPSGSPLPPQYPYPNPSHTSPSPSPSFGTFPPFMMTPPLALHTLLSNHTTSKFGPLSLDFTDTNFNYRVFHAPATNPPVTAITLVFNEDDFVKPTNAIDLTAIQASSLPAVRVADVLDVIYRTLNRPITRIEWDQLAEKEKLHVTQAFNSRCSGSYRERVRAEGVKKVDYARRTRFRALVEVERRIYKVMLE